MNKEEIYNFLVNNEVHKYNLLNEIYAIRDKRYENVDYTICVNGFISVDVLNKNIVLITDNEKLKSQLDIANKKLDKIEELCDIAIKNSYTYVSLNHSGVLMNAHEVKEIIKGEDK